MRRCVLLLQTVCFTLCFASCQNISESVLNKNKYVIPDSVFYEFDTINQFSLIAMGGDIIDRQYPYFTDDFELLSRWKVYQCKDFVQLKRFQNQCLQSAVYVVNPTDSLFFVFDNERSLKYEYDTILLGNLFENIPDCGHLIPNLKKFLDYQFLPTDQTPDSMVFYVLNFGDSFVLPQDYVYNWKILPDKIKHGYSSGVAFDNNAPNRIYSWTIAW